jgi:hypothetical protein
MSDSRKVFDINGLGTARAGGAITAAFDSTIVFDHTQNGNSAAFKLAVQFTGNGQVGLTTDASPVHGQLLLCENDGECTVQIWGGVLLPAGNAATVTAGSKIVGALGAASAKGYIRNVAAATLAEVAVARHTIMDASDPTAVQVFLGV